MIRLRLKLSIMSARNRVSTFTMLVLSILIAIFEIPIISRNISNAIVYGLIALFILLNINLFANLDNLGRNALFSTVLYLIYIAIFKVLHISSAALSYYSTTVKFLFIYIAFLAIYRHLTSGQKKYLLYLTTGIIMCVLLDNFRLYVQYGPSRYVYLFRDERFTSNGVNTVYVSALLLMAGTYFVGFLKNKRKVFKYLSLVLAVLLTAFSVGIAQRTIILLLSLIMFPLLMIFSNAQKTRNIVIETFIAIFFVMVLTINYRVILNWIGDLSGSARVQKRVEQALTIISKGIENSGGSGEARVTYMLRSIKTMFSSIVSFTFGSGDHRSSYDIIGNHSQILDEFARYGFFGGTIMVTMVRSFYKCIIRNTGLHKCEDLCTQFQIIFLMFVLRGFLGNIFEPTISIQLFIIVPSIFDLLNTSRNGNRLESN